MHFFSSYIAWLAVPIQMQQLHYNKIVFIANYSCIDGDEVLHSVNATKSSWIWVHGSNIGGAERLRSRSRASYLQKCTGNACTQIYEVPASAEILSRLEFI